MARNLAFFGAADIGGGGFEEGRLERVEGIEPSYAAWEAAVLPLNYTRLSKT